MQGRLRQPQEGLQQLQGRLRPPQEGLQQLQGRLRGVKSYVGGFKGSCVSAGSLQKRACPPREKSIRSCAIVSDVQNARSSLGQRLTSKLLGAPLLLILLTLLLTVVGGFGLSKLRNEEDILAFLPEGDAQVTAFKDVAKRFGALRVALIGVAPKNGSEVFSSDLLSRMERLSTALKNTQGVDRVVSLSTMTDLLPSEGGVDVMPLVPSPVPSDPGTLAKLKARALSLPSVRGNCLSGDGKSALVMVFFSEGSKTRELAIQTRELARTELSAAASLYFGGAPFAGQSIYDDTQRDVGRLTPVALLLFFFVVLLAFWDAVPVFLTVVTVGLSAVLVLGGMGLLGVPFTVVTGTLPLILFASGSQYAIHILGRYYLVRGASPQLSPVQAAAESMRIAGPPVTVAALNCALGFLSFLVMNIGAMRAFGVAAAGGAVCCWLLSVTVLPAVVARWQGRRSSTPSHARFTALGAVMLRVFALVRRQRVAVAALAVAVAAVCGAFMTRVQVRMEPSAFFRPGSEPAEAQHFLDTQFGGAQFAQVVVEGDVTDPQSLSELRRLAAYARSLPGVTQVQSIVQPLSMVSEAMAGMRGLPGKRAQVATLLFFIEGEPSLRMLLSPDRQAALLHVRVLGDAQAMLKPLQSYVQSRWPFSLRRHSDDELAEELSWLLPESQRATRIESLRGAVARIRKEAPALLTATPSSASAGGATSTVGGGAAPAVPASAGAAPLPGTAAGAGTGGVGADAAPAPLGAGVDAGGATPDPEQAAAARLSAAQKICVGQLLEALRFASTGTDAAEGTLGGRPADEVRAELELVATALLAPPEDAAAKGATLTAQVTGEPVLNEAFSRSVDKNQWASLGLALLSVLVVLLVAQRSLRSAVLSLLPAVLSLLIVFGVLGMSGRPIDLGTSLVGSIVTSSGADFAMHYIWYLRRQPAREVVTAVGPVILTTAVLLGLGMGVLMLGASPPIRLFGGLSCAGMLLSAAFTFLLVPPLLGKLPGDVPEEPSGELQTPPASVP